MLGKLLDEKIFAYFEELSKIPRGSYHCEKINEYLINFAINKGLSFYSDVAKNVIIRKEGTKECKSDDTVILQMHMDMVCEAEAGYEHDFKKDGLSLYIDGDFIKAKETTLGADNGIALAYALAILDSDEYEHPPLEVLVTTDEEVGMLGAIALDLTKLKGKYLINLDTEEEGYLLSACAGGQRVNVTFSFDRFIKNNGSVVQISLDGLYGGHSGMDIDKNRMNATILLGRLLWSLMDNCKFELIELQGGKADNVITRNASAMLWVNDAKIFEECFRKNNTVIIKEIQTAEPNAIFTYKYLNQEAYTMGGEMTKSIIQFVNLVPQGVQMMSEDMKGIVESSLNMGCAKTNNDRIEFGFLLRSQKASYTKYLYEKICELVEFFGGTYENEIEYPSWDFKKDSKLRDIMLRVYKEQYGKEMIVTGVHAGLECGVFFEGISGVDIVSLGPDMYDVHSPKERLSISSTRRVFDYLVWVLRELG